MAWIAAIIVGVVGVAGASFSRSDASKARRKQRKLIAGQIQFYQSLWDDYKKKYGAIEDKMIKEVKQGLNYKRFADTAQEDVQSGFDRAKNIGQRRMESYGLTPAGGGFEQNMRNFDAEEAKTVAGARNRARNYVTDTNFNRRINALKFGGSLRVAAMNGLTGASGNMARLYGDEAARLGRASDEYAQGAIGNIGTAVGAMFNDSGGQQNQQQPINNQQSQSSQNYLQGWNGFNPRSNKDWLGAYYGGGSGVQNYAKGGLVEGIVDAVAGFLPPKNADETIKMRNLYKQYNIEAQTSGQPVADWGQWLNQQGYELTQDGQVAPMEAQPETQAPQENIMQRGLAFRDGGSVDAYAHTVGKMPAYNDGGTVDAYAHTVGATPAYANGGPIATGLTAMSPNQVTGPGGIDKVPSVIDGKTAAKLSSGEFVMSREATMHHGLKRLDAMNDEWKKDKTTGGV